MIPSRRTLLLKSVSVTKALAAAVAYTANDVLSESAASGTDWDFDEVVRENGGCGEIVGATIQSESESVTPRCRLFLFTAAPTNCNLNDNAANTAPDASDLPSTFVGFIDFPAMSSLGTTDSVAVANSNVPSCNLPLPFVCDEDDDALYGVLVTKDGFTQTAGDDLTITLIINRQ